MINFNPSEITENEENLKFLLHFPTLSNPLNILMLSKIWVYCDLENYPQPNFTPTSPTLINIDISISIVIRLPPKFLKLLFRDIIRQGKM